MGAEAHTTHGNSEEFQLVISKLETYCFLPEAIRSTSRLCCKLSFLLSREVHFPWHVGTIDKWLAGSESV